MKVSVVIPTYNEAEGILVFIKKLKKIFKSLEEYSYEFIIIDDDSPDGTADLVKNKYKKDKRIKLYVRKNIRELATAILYGIKKATGEIILGIDADGNHQPERIPALLKELKNYDLVTASRFIKGGGVEAATDIIRFCASFCLNFYLKVVGFPTWDSASGFYGISLKKLKTLNLEKIYYGYGEYHLRLVYFAKLKNYSIKEVPYVYKKRIAGKSKSRLFKMFFDYLIEGTRLAFTLSK